MDSAPETKLETTPETQATSDRPLDQLARQKSATGAPPAGATSRPSSRRLVTRMMIWLRRAHMYAGLFLLPWVLLYGITGAMFNHYGLLTDADIVNAPSGLLAETAMAEFPTGDALAEQIVTAIRQASPETDVERDASQPAEFVNNLVLQVADDNQRHAVFINPVDQSTWVSTTPQGQFGGQELLSDVEEVELDSSPYALAEQVVPQVLEAVGKDMIGDVRSFGRCRLNFAARVDGIPARITYSLEDGRVSVTEETGSPRMTMRSLFLRLHTTHGQPPGWNARMVWSVFVDVMAIAMVLWGLTGVVMWWQIKRTRVVGGVVLLASVAAGAAVYVSMLNYYSTTALR